jgi:hypothetical protein
MKNNLRRGQRLLIAQRPGPPLGEPPNTLTPEQQQAWRDVAAACPDVLRATDRPFVAMIATHLWCWRSLRQHEVADRTTLLTLYRMLGHCFVPMRERRRLLLPERAGAKPT